MCCERAWIIRGCGARESASSRGERRAQAQAQAQAAAWWKHVKERAGEKSVATRRRGVVVSARESVDGACCLGARRGCRGETAGAWTLGMDGWSRSATSR